MTPDADLKMTIMGTVFGAVGTCGQRCTSTRRLIVHEKVYEKVKDALVKAYSQIKIGNPLDSNMHVGPLIDLDAVKSYEKALSQIEKEGGNWIVEGGVLSGNQYDSGCYVKPVIAEVNGIATAAGCQLVASCDLAVSSDSSKFATPGVNIGLFCSTPMVALSRNVSQKNSMKMLLTGDMISADEAKRISLINDCVPEEQLTKLVMDLAEKISKKSQEVLKIGKEAFYKQSQLNIEDAYEYTSKVMTKNMMIDDAFEGINAFLEKRNPKWKNK